MLANNPDKSVRVKKAGLKDHRNHSKGEVDKDLIESRFGSYF